LRKPAVKVTSNNNSPAPLNGLILSGGKSRRMGKDKGMLSYHGIPQLAHLIQLLKPYCEQVFVSAKTMADYPNYHVIEDKYDINSPLNGILSAINTYPNKGWIVVACDMPLISAKSIQHLIGHRESTNLATCYTNEESLIEPLFCIWEPHAFESLMVFHNNGELSPRKFLSSNLVSVIIPNDYSVLTNVNSIAHYEKFK
jgi:molybdopterin-guanine dinucleotide biosynthesis protein A